MPVPIRMVQGWFNADFNTESIFNFWVCIDKAAPRKGRFTKWHKNLRFSLTRETHKFIIWKVGDLLTTSIPGGGGVMLRFYKHRCEDDANHCLASYCKPGLDPRDYGLMRVAAARNVLAGFVTSSKHIKTLWSNSDQSDTVFNRVVLL